MNLSMNVTSAGVASLVRKEHHLGVSPVAEGHRTPYFCALACAENLSASDLPMKTTVLLADDHPPLLEAATAILKPHFDVVGTATDGAMLVSEALRLRPDVVVTDITMPVLNGIEAVSELRDSGFSTTFVFLTIHANEEFLKACLAEGALGYVLKSHMKTHLVAAVQSALKGESYISPFVARP